MFVFAIDMPFRGPLVRLQDYRLPSNAHALSVASSTDIMSIVLTLLRNSYGTAWHGTESSELRDTLCSSGFSLIATRLARSQHLISSLWADRLICHVCRPFPILRLRSLPFTQPVHLLERNHESCSSRPRTRPGIRNMSSNFDEACDVVIETPDSCQPLER